MPSLKYVKTISGICSAPQTFIGFTVIDGKVALAMFSPKTSGLYLIFEDGNAYKLHDPITKLDNNTRVLLLNIDRNNNIRARIAFADVNKLNVADVYIDVSNRTCELDIIKTFDKEWIDNHFECTGHAVSLSEKVLAMVDVNNSVLRLVDCDTGNEVTKSSPVQGYFPRPSLKCVVNIDDIYMLYGVHLNYESFYMLKLYSGEVKNLNVVSGSGSPRVQIGNLGLFSDEYIFASGSGGVVYSNNNVIVFDDKFNKIFSIDSKNITGFDTDLIPGISIIAKTEDNTYIMSIAGYEHTGSNNQRGALYIVEVDRKGDILNKWKIYETTGSVDVFYLPKSDYTDWVAKPVIDMNRKLLFMFGEHVDSNRNPNALILSIDISDIWDRIREFTRDAWIVTGKTVRIPTRLTLNVEVL